MGRKKAEKTSDEQIKEPVMEENTKSRNELSKDKKKLEQKRDRLLEVELDELIRFDIVKKTDEEDRVYYETVKEIDGKVRNLTELQNGISKFQVHSCDTLKDMYIELSPNQKFYVERELPKLNRDINRLEKQIKDYNEKA